MINLSPSFINQVLLLQGKKPKQLNFTLSLGGSISSDTFPKQMDDDITVCLSVITGGTKARVRRCYSIQTDLMPSVF